jgi:hypothetical protein
VATSAVQVGGGVVGCGRTKGVPWLVVGGVTVKEGEVRKMKARRSRLHVPSDVHAEAEAEARASSSKSTHTSERRDAMPSPPHGTQMYLPYRYSPSADRLRFLVRVQGSLADILGRSGVFVCVDVDVGGCRWMPLGSSCVALPWLSLVLPRCCSTDALVSGCSLAPGSLSDRSGLGGRRRDCVLSRYCTP